MVSEGTSLSLSVAGSDAGLAEVVDSFDRFSSALALPDEARRSVQIALDELLSNTVRCGRAGTRELTIEVGFHVETDTLRVEIVDDGILFNPLERPDPDTTLPLEERPVGGLGVMLVRHLVDEITYDRKAGRNRVRIARRLRA
jgi:anti-sigma regulatory factor (Ser/Thr protein kinase)